MSPDLRAKLLRWASILIPVVLCIVVYLQNRSLFLDSLNLARNVVDRSMLGLVEPLSYEQSAPLLFLWVSKLFTLVLGVNEYILRLFPLLAGIGSLYFFSKISTKFLSNPLAYVAVFWLGCHELFVRYATEYKQYMIDVFAVVFLISMAIKHRKVSKKNFIPLAISGVVIMWLSMPSIFVLGAIVIWFGLNSGLKGESVKYLSGLILIYGLSFIGEYLVILSPAMHTTHMQNFHNNFFFDGRFWNMEALSHDLGLIVSSVKLLVGKTGVALGAAFASIIIGVYASFINKRTEVVLLVLPILAAFFAALLGKYSIVERLMLFTLPLLVLLVLQGVEYVWSLYRLRYKSWGLVTGILALGLMLGFVHRQGLKYLVGPLDIEDNKSCLEYIAYGPQPDLEIICTDLAFPAYDYYVRLDDNYKEDLPFTKGIVTHYNTDIIGLARIRAMKNGAVWVLACHKSDNELDTLVKKLDEVGTIKNSYRASHSIAILFTQ